MSVSYESIQDEMKQDIGHNEEMLNILETVYNLINMKIKIVVRSTEAFAELNNTKTASAVVEALPFESIAHRWGEEIYFEIPLKLELENGKDILEIGDVAYWPPSKSMCIFFGPTPSSKGNEVRAYSPVSVFGRIIGEAKIFRNVKEGERIRVEIAN